MFFILPQPQPPHRPIKGDQTRILDFQQLCLESVIAASNGVQIDPAFSMQDSRRSQKLFLGSDFFDNLLRVHPRHYAYSDCLGHKSLT